MSITNFISRRFNSGRFLPRSIRAMRAVAMIGIAVSVAALIVAISIGRGFEGRYRRALMDFNAHIVVMGGAEMTKPREVMKQLDSVWQPTDGVVGVTPFIYREALSVGGGEINGVVVKGVDPSGLTDIVSMTMKFSSDGSSIEEALGHRDGAAIPVIAGRALAEKFTIGDTFKLLIPSEGHSRRFETVKIAGRFESGMHDYDAQFLIMSISDMRRMFKIEPDTVTGLEIKLRDPENAASVAARIEDEIGPVWRAVTWSELNNDLLAAVRLEKLVLSVVMGLLVAVAALNIVAVLVLMGIYRLREIAILKAIGLNNRSVRAVLVRGGALVTLVGVFAGVVLGVGLAFVVGRMRLIPLEAEIYLIDSLPIDISLSICGMLTLVCLGMGFVTSFLAAQKLSRVQIAEGLK